MSKVTVEFDPGVEADVHAAVRAVGGTLETFGHYKIEFVPVTETSDTPATVEETAAVEPTPDQPAVDAGQPAADAPAEAPVEPVAPEVPAEQPTQ